MRADEMCEKYHELKEELSIVTFQLAHFHGITEEDMIEALTFSWPEEMERVQTSNISNKTEKIALCLNDMVDRTNDEWYQFLVKRYRYLDGEVSFFEHCVKRLGDKYYNVFMDILEGEMTYEQIAEVYGIGRTTVFSYKRLAIEELNKLYDLREREDVDFMLS